ncbi:GSCOCG00010652001-RA-CDS [Cotesia congregata]|uniref:Uncharacterized protein n=1 Tax=Cotesia congregata TaxID=51543 RepID=A0A8J2ECW9_COTCN|nr:GSCOCG00010652001-RA-CDS [Cotesia congregata]CAG5075072.1 Protein of unknown function [Cotesia congregata]
MAATSWVLFACIVLFACTSANPVNNIEPVLEAAVNECRYSQPESEQTYNETDPQTIEGFGTVNLTCWFKELKLIEFTLNQDAIVNLYTQVITQEKKTSGAKNINLTAVIDIVRDCSNEKAESEKKVVEKFMECFKARKESLYNV